MILEYYLDLLSRLSGSANLNLAVTIFNLPSINFACFSICSVISECAL